MLIYTRRAAPKAPKKRSRAGKYAIHRQLRPRLTEGELKDAYIGELLQDESTAFAHADWFLVKKRCSATPLDHTTTLSNTFAEEEMQRETTAMRQMRREGFAVRI
jgi:hypothetical protein